MISQFNTTENGIIASLWSINLIDNRFCLAKNKKSTAENRIAKPIVNPDKCMSNIGWAEEASIGNAKYEEINILSHTNERIYIKS